MLRATHVGRVLLLLLLIPRSASGSDPVPAQLDARLLSANPDSPVSALFVRDQLHGKIGVPIPLFGEPEKLSLTLPALIELHNRNGAGFGPAAGEMLARGKSLVLLSMIYLHIGDQGLRELVGSPNVSKLEEIHLEGNDITDDGLTLIAEAKHLKSLRRLPNLFHGRSTLDPKGNGAKAVRARFGEEIFEGGRYT